MRKVRPPLPPRVIEALARFGAGLKNLRAPPYANGLCCLGVYATVLLSYGMLERLEVALRS